MRSIKHKQNASLDNHRAINPYGDSNCFFHSVNFSILAKLANGTLSKHAQQSIVDSGFINEIIAVARECDMQLQVDKTRSLGGQLTAILSQITIAPNAKPKNVTALLGQVHWGVWQKLAGQAARRVANKTLNEHPELVSEGLYREFVLDFKQLVLATLYPKAGYALVSDRLQGLIKTPAVTAAVNDYIEKYRDQYPDPDSELTDADIQRATREFDKIHENQADASIDENYRRSLETIYYRDVLPAWYGRETQNDVKHKVTVGNEHKCALEHAWGVEIEQASYNERLDAVEVVAIDVSLVPMDVDVSSPDQNKPDKLIVEHSGTHYIAHVDVEDSPAAHTMVNAARADKTRYMDATATVKTRFGTWTAAEEFYPSVKTAQANEPSTEQKKMKRSKPLPAEQSKQAFWAVFDAALARHVANQQDAVGVIEDPQALAAAEQSQVNSFYNKLASAAPNSKAGKLYQKAVALDPEIAVDRASPMRCS